MSINEVYAIRSALQKRVAEYVPPISGSVYTFTRVQLRDRTSHFLSGEGTSQHFPRQENFRAIGPSEEGDKTR